MTAWLVALASLVSLAVQSLAPTLDAAKASYGQASYQEALEILGKLKGGGAARQDVVEVDKYRAFCLLALGRTSEARQVFSEILITTPDFRLDEREVSRRVFEAFREVRRQWLPSALSRAFARGRQAYELQLPDEAEREFQLALELAADPDMPLGAPLAAETRELAKGYLDLLEAKRAPIRSRRIPGLAVLPEMEERIFSDADQEVVPPEPILQQFPPWPPTLSKVRMQGVLEVVIGKSGLVESTAMPSPLHPLYDALVLEQARQWRYKPAVRGTSAVKYRKRIQVRIAPAPEGT